MRIARPSTAFRCRRVRTNVRGKGERELGAGATNGQSCPEKQGGELDNLERRTLAPGPPTQLKKIKEGNTQSQSRIVTVRESVAGRQ